MKPTWLAMGLLASSVVAGTLVAACDDAPPGGPSTGVIRAEINGPASIAPGQTASFSVIEYLTNGTSRALPSATWSSSNPSLVAVTPSGMATAQPRTGEIVLSVRTGSAQATKEVIVQPDGTFRLVGRVTDSALPTVPLADVRVEVTGGPAVNTGTDGRYRLYGAPRDAELRVSREGYFTLVQRLQLSANTTFDVRLEIDGSTRNFAGNYTLTVEAVPGCPRSSRPMPESLRLRSYAAIIRQTGARLEVELVEPRFVAREGFPGNRFDGMLTPTGASFILDADYYYLFADVLEQLSDGSFIAVTGRATTTGSPAGLSGTLNGWFTHYLGNFSYLDGCPAGAFSLSPR